MANLEEFSWYDSLGEALLLDNDDWNTLSMTPSTNNNAISNANTTSNGNDFLQGLSTLKSSENNTMNALNLGSNLAMDLGGMSTSAPSSHHNVNNANHASSSANNSTMDSIFMNDDMFASSSAASSSLLPTEIRDHPIAQQLSAAFGDTDHTNMNEDLSVLEMDSGYLPVSEGVVSNRAANANTNASINSILGNMGLNISNMNTALSGMGMAMAMGMAPTNSNGNVTDPHVSLMDTTASAAPPAHPLVTKASEAAVMGAGLGSQDELKARLMRTDSSYPHVQVEMGISWSLDF